MYVKCKILVIYRARIGYSKLGYPIVLVPKDNTQTKFQVWVGFVLHKLKKFKQNFGYLVMSSS